MRRVESADGTAREGEVGGWGGRLSGAEPPILRAGRRARQGAARLELRINETSKVWIVSSMIEQSLDPQLEINPVPCLL